MSGEWIELPGDLIVVRHGRAIRLRRGDWIGWINGVPFYVRGPRRRGPRRL